VLKAERDGFKCELQAQGQRVGNRKTLLSKKMQRSLSMSVDILAGVVARLTWVEVAQ